MYRLKSPLTVQIELTEACNNACYHCYNYWRYIETGKKLSVDSHENTLYHFEVLLDHLIRNEVMTVSFTGGEPFLRRDILFYLIRKAKQGGMKAGVNTNGALINENDVERLVDVGADFLLVSLLSDDPSVHNKVANSVTHNLTSGAIRQLAKADLNVTVNMVVSSHNWGRVRETGLYAKDLGAGIFSATPTLPCPLARNHQELLLSPQQVIKVLDDLLWLKSQGMRVDVLEPLPHCLFNDAERLRFSQFLNYRSCSAGISDMVIGPCGDVRACILSTQIGGNLISESWDEVWGNLAGWCSPSLLPDECLDCEEVDACGGGCRIAALATSGKLNGKDPYMAEPIHLVPLASESLSDITKVSEDMVIGIPDNTRLRSEEFGCVISRGRIFTFLDEDGTKFFRYLMGRRSFSVKSVIEDVNIEEEVMYHFLSSLINRNFLDIISTDERR